ncbi:MAG: CvpA family protein [SAR202 cluster bacterium]|jgi:membrane protein required for colicin V production|nr:CvpA family protein [SAR202 cluster bacterium]
MREVMGMLDIVLITVIVVAGYYGQKTGLIKAAFTAAGVVVGVLLAGQLSDDVGAWFTDSVSNDSVVTVISYAIVVGGALVAGKILGDILSLAINIVLLGWANKLGGLALGLLVGAAISGALITGLARLTYNFELQDTGTPGQVVARFTSAPEVRDWLEDRLMDSSLVPTFIDITDALPADALGFVPSDFHVALEILKERI